MKFSASFMSTTPAHSSSSLPPHSMPRYLQLLGRDEPLPAEGYQGEYMIDYAQQVLDSRRRTLSGYGSHELPSRRSSRSARRSCSPLCSEELGKLGVHFDRWFREQSLYDDGLVDQVLQQAARAG